MSDERMIRIDNLRLLMQQNAWKQADLCRVIGKSDAYVSKLLGKKSSFGEKAARYIEERCKKPRGWLDEVHPGAAYPPVASTTKPDRLDTPPPRVAREPLPGSSAAFTINPLSDSLIPIITWEHIEMLELDNADPRLKSCAQAPAEGANGSKTKWIIMKDESGGDRFPVGARLKVDADLNQTPVKPGKYVVVKDARGCYAVRRYVAVSGTHFRAEAHNDAFATLDSERDGLEVVAVVTQALIDC